MKNQIKAFQVEVNGKLLDYRLGQKLDLDDVKTFFSRKYKIEKLWLGDRHLLGIVKENNQELFLKLATSEGISFVTRIEYQWNECFNKLVSREKSVFWVPKNYSHGLYKNLFYLITDKFDGELFTEKPGKTKISKTFLDNTPSIIEFSEFIQELNIDNLAGQVKGDYRKCFFKKTHSWYDSIPEKVIEKHKLADLLNIVEADYLSLEKRLRHGDFAPWHLLKLKNGKIGLIDGEHTTANGVEYYDIGYFIQRVFCVLENPSLAKKILSLLIDKKYNWDKLRVILAARAIGGFLDETLKESSNYDLYDDFKKWVISLKQSCC